MVVAKMIGEKALEIGNNLVYALYFLPDFLKLKKEDFLNNILSSLFRDRYPHFTVTREKNDGTEKNPYRLRDELRAILNEQSLYHPSDPWRIISGDTIGRALAYGTDRHRKSSLWNLEGEKNLNQKK